MALHLLSTKSLPEPMLTYIKLDLHEQSSVKIELGWCVIQKIRLEMSSAKSRNCVWGQIIDPQFDKHHCIV